eukprot:TRINITY_DN1644_c1_g1_i1.p1 TRINITY_DN1644_c1_g1~~TRINITY_DN1644_c1_g1_i1.p1  ORF type:complete len:190 (+),score=40.81 TRINITY_DN1644_c1_g1_i1:92-661(+)
MPVTMEQGRGRGAVRGGRSASSPAVMRRGRSRTALVIIEDEMLPMTAEEEVTQGVQAVRVPPVQTRAPPPQSKGEWSPYSNIPLGDWTPPTPVWAEPIRMPCQCAACVTPPPMPVQPGDWNTMFQIPPWAHLQQWNGACPEGMLPDPIFKKRRRRGRRGRGGRGKKQAQLLEEAEEASDEIEEQSSDSQ